MTENPELRDRAITAANEAISRAGFWLPPAGQAAAVDAVLAQVAAELDASQRRAIRIQTLLDEERVKSRKTLASLRTLIAQGREQGAKGITWDALEAALEQPASGITTISDTEMIHDA